MDRCDFINPLLSAYHDGELAEAESTLVKTHVVDCPSCSQELLDLGLVGHELRQLLAPPELPDFTAAVMARLPAHPPRRAWLGRVRPPEWSAGWMAGLSFASAALAVGAWIILLMGGRASHAMHATSSNFAAAAQPAISQPQTVAATDQDSQAYISRLETKAPSVAVWSEPENKTTVIWLPDEDSGDN
ncbi:MAG TPA: zf-HC2 domain-containing protein [Candidatus Binataceae bacterium]|nr:zf-HC2 domain-containing protein [Candidatus Binataceae bacterium]